MSLVEYFTLSSCVVSYDNRRPIIVLRPGFRLYSSADYLSSSLDRFYSDIGLIYEGVIPFGVLL